MLLAAGQGTLLGEDILVDELRTSQVRASCSTEDSMAQLSKTNPQQLFPCCQPRVGLAQFRLTTNDTVNSENFRSSLLRRRSSDPLCTPPSLHSGLGWEGVKMIQSLLGMI